MINFLDNTAISVKPKSGADKFEANEVIYHVSQLTEGVLKPKSVISITKAAKKNLLNYGYSSKHDS